MRLRWEMPLPRLKGPVCECRKTEGARKRLSICIRIMEDGTVMQTGRACISVAQRGLQGYETLSCSKHQALAANTRQPSVLPKAEKAHPTQPTHFLTPSEDDGCNALVPPLSGSSCTIVTVEGVALLLASSAISGP